MENKLEVYYTPRAQETLTLVIQFITDKFGKNVADKFLIKADKIIALISFNPMMFKSSNIDSNIRVGLITKQCSLFYRVTEKSIHLPYFWDNRQEPSAV